MSFFVLTVRTLYFCTSSLFSLQRQHACECMNQQQLYQQSINESINNIVHAYVCVYNLLGKLEG